MNTRPKPAPDGSTTEKLVDQLRKRHAEGLAKYGTTLDRQDLTAAQWIQHHREELLDALGYLQRIEDNADELRQRNIRLQAQLDQRWELNRELEAECGTKDVQAAVKFIRGLNERVKRLEAAGDVVALRLSLWKYGNEWLCSEDEEAYIQWTKAKEAKP